MFRAQRGRKPIVTVDVDLAGNHLDAARELALIARKSRRLRWRSARALRFFNIRELCFEHLHSCLEDDRSRCDQAMASYKRVINTTTDNAEAIIHAELKAELTRSPGFLTRWRATPFEEKQSNKRDILIQQLKYNLRNSSAYAVADGKFKVQLIDRGNWVKIIREGLSSAHSTAESTQRLETTKRLRQKCGALMAEQKALLRVDFPSAAQQQRIEVITTEIEELQNSKIGNGWKLHLAIDEAPDNLGAAWNIVVRHLYEAEIPFMKVLAKGRSLQPWQEQRGKQITVYLGSTALVTQFSENIKRFLYRVESDFRIQGVLQGVKSEGDASIVDSNYFSYRNDRAEDGRYVDATDTLADAAPHNPGGGKDPFADLHWLDPQYGIAPPEYRSRFLAAPAVARVVHRDRQGQAATATIAP